MMPVVMRQIVRECAVALRDEGWKITQIGAWLDSREYLTENGTKWSPQALSRTLHQRHKPHFNMGYLGSPAGEQIAAVTSIRIDSLVTRAFRVGSAA